MDLTTEYLGLKLKNPVIPSSSPLAGTLDSAKALEDAGASAIVLHSIFEEQIEHETHELDHYLTQGTESYAEALDYFPVVSDFLTGTEEYLKHISELKKALGIPVIGSLNGVSRGGWMKYAKLIEEAGADAIELNTYYIPTDCDKKGEEIENIYINNLRTIKKSINIPVAMKLSPYFSSMSNIAKTLDEQGADALVLFNRFYQPDINLETLEVEPNLVLSSNWEMRLPLRWIAILYGKIKANLAATSGIHNYKDVIKVLMAGADVAMVCSALYLNGTKYLTVMLDGLKNWMEENEYDSIKTMKGSMSQKSVTEPAAFERANYMKTLQSFKKLL